MKHAYVLGGGGGKIGFVSGVLCALREKGITPSIISGISSGNLAGIMAATNQYSQLEHLLRYRITDNMIFKKRSLPGYLFRLGLHKVGLKRPEMGLYDNSPLQNLLKEMLHGRQTVCDFYTGVVEINTDTFYHVRIPKGTVLNASHLGIIRASTAIPFVFEPVRLDSTDLLPKGIYVDGGVHHNVPLEPASQVIKQRPDITNIIAVSMSIEKELDVNVNDDLDMVSVLVNGILYRTAVDLRVLVVTSKAGWKPAFRFDTLIY